MSLQSVVDVDITIAVLSEEIWWSLVTYLLFILLTIR